MADDLASRVAAVAAQGTNNGNSPAPAGGDLASRVSAVASGGPSQPAEPEGPPQGFMNATGIPQLIHSAKQSWMDSQPIRDAEANVAKNVSESVKKGDFGTAAEILLNHIGERGAQVASNVYQGAKGNLKANLTELDPNQGKMYATPIFPGPGVGNAAADVAATAEPAAEGPGLMQKVKQAVSPKAAAQPGAQSALREGATASAKDAGVAGAVDTSGSIRTVMDKPIAEAAKVEDKLYKTVNNAAETDMKSLYDRREELQDAIEDPTNVGQKSNIQKELTTTDQAIAQGEANVKTKLGKDAPDLIKQAKDATQQRYSMEEGVKKLFNNEGVISGNVAHGVQESINVDSAIRQAENLDKPSKFAPRGTPTRLQQMFGEEGAKAFKQGLYDAQKDGQKVMTRHAVLGIVTSGGGLLAYLKH